MTTPTLDTTLQSLRDRFLAVKESIEAADFRADGTFKTEVAAIYRDVDAAIGQLTQLKDEMRQFVEQWRTHSHPHSHGQANADVNTPSRHGTPPAFAPTFSGERPVVHEDHIGASTYLEKGWSKISSGDYAGAEEILLRALTLAPNSTEGQSLLGWAQMLQDKLDAALMHFQSVLSRDPANALARINVGYICLKKGIFGEAIEHLSKALRQGDDSTSSSTSSLPSSSVTTRGRAVLYANFYLGLVYTEREMYDDACVFFEKAIVLGPNLVEAYVELGHAHWLADRHADALAVWQRGAAANSYSPWSARCAELLDVVRGGGEPVRTWLSRGTPSPN